MHDYEWADFSGQAIRLSDLFSNIKVNIIEQSSNNSIFISIMKNRWMFCMARLWCARRISIIEFKLNKYITTQVFCIFSLCCFTRNTRKCCRCHPQYPVLLSFPEVFHDADLSNRQLTGAVYVTHDAQFLYHILLL